MIFDFGDGGCGLLPVGKTAKKYSLKECVFVNLTLKIQCNVVKNTLLQTALSAILPAGLVVFMTVAYYD